jgi:hypothetical protein
VTEPPERFWALVVSALTLSGCGGEDVVLGDGRSGAVQGQHAVPAFSEVAVMTTISAPGTIDDDPSLSADLSQMYFDSKRVGGLGQEDIWKTDRRDQNDAWTPPEIVPELNSPDRETGIALSADGLSIWFSSNRTGTSGGLDVFVATRQTASDAWSTPERVTELSTSEDDLVSSVDASTRTLNLALRSDADSDYDLYVSVRASDGAPWEAPTEIAEINTGGAESDAFPVEREAGLLFTRSEELVIARRAGSAGPYRVDGPLSALNSPADDRDPWSTDDVSYVVFSSNRSGQYLLYEARR